MAKCLKLVPGFKCRPLGHFRSPISEAPSADQPELDVQRPQRAQLEDQQLQNPGIHVPHLVSVRKRKEPGLMSCVAQILPSPKGWHSTEVAYELVTQHPLV